MEICAATHTDTPAIVELLKKSLGEGLMPKSAAYWEWKHLKNPFGTSKVLLAKEGDKLIGVRAFMKWNWIQNGHTITSVRAVDTATDPSQQGKGIFSKLTMQAVDECKAEGIALVFNTPNEKSKPGYLKMGWEEAGRMPLYFRPGSIIPRSYSEEYADHIYSVYRCQSSIAGLFEDWTMPNEENYIQTSVNVNYLNWRYPFCPNVKYGAIVQPGSFGIIFRLKKLWQFYELRICEYWTERSAADLIAGAKAFKQLIKQTRPILVSVSLAPPVLKSFKKNLFFFGPLDKGPITTVRPLAPIKSANFIHFNSWAPSIGTMELF